MRHSPAVIMCYCLPSAGFARVSQQSHGIRYLRVSATMNFYRHFCVISSLSWCAWAGCVPISTFIFENAKCNNNRTLIKESILIKAVRERNSAMRTITPASFSFLEACRSQSTCNIIVVSTSTACPAARFSECNFHIMSDKVIAINENITFSDRLTFGEASQSVSLPRETVIFIWSMEFYMKMTKIR